MRSKRGRQRFKPARTCETMDACIYANFCRITNCMIPDSIQSYVLLDNVYVYHALQGWAMLRAKATFEQSRHSLCPHCSDPSLLSCLGRVSEVRRVP